MLLAKTKIDGIIYNNLEHKQLLYIRKTSTFLFNIILENSFLSINFSYLVVGRALAVVENL